MHSSCFGVTRRIAPFNQIDTQITEGLVLFSNDGSLKRCFGASILAFLFVSRLGVLTKS